MSEQRFIDGEYFEDEIVTPEGPLAVCAEVRIEGSHLTLNEILVFGIGVSGSMPAGTRLVRLLFRRIRTLAFEAGFSTLTVVYHRVGKQRLGDTITRTRKLP